MPVSATPPADVTAILLAAGASRRFGPANKLLASFRGQPLISHAAQALRSALPQARRIAVIADPEMTSLLGEFEVIQIPQGQQSDSLRAGLAAAGSPARLLIALGDMPHVSPALLRAVLDACTDDSPSASQDGASAPMPPACFPQSYLPRLAALTGDQGAGRLIHDLPAARLVQTAGQLADIDTRAELRQMQV